MMKKKSSVAAHAAFKVSSIATVGGAFVLSACSGTVEGPDANPTPHDSVQAGPGLFSGESGNLLDSFNKKGGGITSLFGGTQAGAPGIGVNGYLWRAALETISFLPLQSADSNGGVLITDWRTRPDRANERIKATVYIFGTQLTAQAVQVVLFKQYLQENGQWTDVPADEATARKLEEIILTKARDLKVAASQPQ